MGANAHTHTHLADGVVLLLGHARVAVGVHAVDAPGIGVGGLRDGLGLQTIVSNLIIVVGKTGHQYRRLMERCGMAHFCSLPVSAHCYMPVGCD